VVVMAPSSPADCFETVLDAARIALQHMVPVLVLSDNYIANGAEPWQLPAVEDLKPIEINHPEALPGDETFQPFSRDERLVRPWALVGTPGLEHRIGGLEKEDVSGNISYGAENHGLMTDMRRRKVENLASSIPPVAVEGDPEGDLLVLGWGSTHGAITSAVENAQAAGTSVSAAYLRYLNPFPANLGEILSSFNKVLIPELNTGQLLMLIRSRYLVYARGLNKVRGQNFLIHEIEDAITGMLAGDWGERLIVAP
jgi:2-oxoglutarate ferredoxin oxidoreductase subunit alpha